MMPADDLGNLRPRKLDGRQPYGRA
jgi:hypothetical protein